MRGEIFGKISTSVVAIVGEWDPILPGHIQLLKKLIKYSKNKSLNSLVVLIDPRPISLLMTPAEFPPYHGVEYRIIHLLKLGINTVIKVRFNKKDVNSTARKFIIYLNSFVNIKELWLGSNQSYGRGKEGSQTAIKEAAKCFNFKLNILQRKVISNKSALENLKNGKIFQIASVLGQGPIWKKPKSGFIRFLWPPGLYFIKLSNNPFDFNIFAKKAFVFLERKNKITELVWPNSEYNWINFVKGPEDHVQKNYANIYKTIS